MNKITTEYIQKFLDKDHPGAKLISIKYKNNREKLEFICEKGHKYKAPWNSVKSGSWCFECNGKKKPTIRTIQKFLDKNHEGAKLISTEYIKAREKLDVICEKGHKIEKTWNAIQQGKWCLECSGSKKKTIEDVKKYIYNYFPGSTLLSTIYISNGSNLKIRCANGHIFYKSWANMHRNWCPHCSESYVESFCRRIIERYFKRPFPKVRPNWLINPKTNCKLELDGFNEELRIAFECDGAQHYYFPNDFHRTKEIFLVQKDRDKLKSELCKNNNIVLVRIKAFNFKNFDNLRKIILNNLDSI